MFHGHLFDCHLVVMTSWWNGRQGLVLQVVLAPLPQQARRHHADQTAHDHDDDDGHGRRVRPVLVAPSISIQVAQTAICLFFILQYPTL